jgi:3-phenylpropionate/trans-cinnamate dioxygenase ferredoxin reductase subunit
VGAERVVIIGAGQAASQLAFSLRQLGHEGPIALLGEEPLPPYQRPPLSKKYLAGEIEPSKLFFRQASAYESRAIALHLGVRATAIDRPTRHVHVANGDPMAYDALVLATGSMPLHLPVPGVDLPGVHRLRTAADADALRAAAVGAERAVIVGGGYIGLETAATLTKLGLACTVLDAAPRLMMRVASPVLSEAMRRFHESHGIAVRLGAQAARIDGGARVERVVCADGQTLQADLVIVGIGGRPQVSLASAAGLTVENGIVVDAHGRTSDPHIFAAGDCTNFPSALYGARLRLESVQNAVDQAKAVAAAIAGAPEDYDPLPWFWSDQFDAKLQLAGIGGPDDEFVVRGDPASMRFGVFRLHENRVVAVEAVNHAEIFTHGKHLVRARAAVGAALLQNESRPLADLIPV